MVSIYINFIGFFYFITIGNPKEIWEIMLEGCVNTLPLRDHAESTKRDNDRGMKMYEVDAIKERRQRKVNWCVLLILLIAGCGCFGHYLTQCQLSGSCL